jgi:hypothetical protein
MQSSAPPPRARIGFGQVRHRRLAPIGHGFAYPTCFLMLPMRSLRRQPDPTLARNRRAPFGFRDADHGDGRADSLAWLDELLAGAGIADADGEVWLHCIPRMFGLAFKPVSFWYAHRADGTLAAIVVEVNNTFGERHCYVLHGEALGWGREIEADKVFHVSPFCETQGRYRFRFMRTADRLMACVDHDDAQGPLIQTSISGVLHELTEASVRRAVVGWPLMTLGVVARIHWQALQLWLKRVPFVSKPAPPSHFASGPRGRRTP